MNSMDGFLSLVWFALGVFQMLFGEWSDGTLSFIMSTLMSNRAEAAK